MAKYYLEIRKTWNYSGKQIGRNERILVETNREPKVGESSRDLLYTKKVVKVEEVR